MSKALSYVKPYSLLAGIALFFMLIELAVEPLTAPADRENH